MHGLTEAEISAVGLLVSSDHIEEGRLTGAIRTDDPNNSAGREFEREIIE